MTNSNRATRVAIADDHPIIRHALGNALTAIPGFSVEAVATSGTELLEALAHGDWDLVVTDFSMHDAQSDHDGLKLITRLRRQHPGVPIIVFTMLTNDDILHRVAQTGVAGILDKCEGIGEFQQAALEIVRHGRAYRSSGVRIRLQQGVVAAQPGGVAPRLSTKELEIIRAFATGATLTDIARQVNRSMSTVATQKGAAMKKLNVRTNAELVKYARDSGLV
jgi:two-component system capsular synthesis response regulator RcsB